MLRRLLAIFCLGFFLAKPFGCLLAEDILTKGSPEKQAQLLQCLEECWGVDQHTAKYICNYFLPTLANNEFALVDDFISKSEVQDIQFPLDQPLMTLSPYDGVVRATRFHPVVFESPYVRIMAGCAEAGEREPFHEHAWKSLFVVFEESKYLIEYENGLKEAMTIMPGVYELSPEQQYACTNLGQSKENCLRFEVKGNCGHSVNGDSSWPPEPQGFEAQIAFFYGVPNPQPVMEAYLTALKQLHTTGLDKPFDLLERVALPHLEIAYLSIAQQRGWRFDPRFAAQLELKIILGNLQGSSFDQVVERMIQLYREVFQSNSPFVLKAAWLRTFLYQYKAETLKSGHLLSEADKQIMLEIAKTSELYLNSIK